MKLTTRIFSVELTSLNKLVMLTLGIVLISGMSHCAPKRRDIWNPYHYPTVRSIISVSALLSMRPRIQQQVKSSVPTTTTATTTTRPPPPPTKRMIVFSTTPKLAKPTRSNNINRRAAHSHSQTQSGKKPRMTMMMGSPMKANNINQTFLGIDLANFDMGNVTAINLALNDFIKSAEHVIREVLTYTQNDLLRVIGQVDQGTNMLQKRLLGSGLRLAFAGQQAATKTYENLPSFVYKLLQRLQMPTDDGRSREQISVQLNEAIKNLRMLKKMLVQAFEEHEKDFHNVFQERFTQINQYLRVPDLPKRPLAWFS